MYPDSNDPPMCDADVEMFKWVAQTVHQAYHTDHPGTWEECPKNICSSVKYWLNKRSKEVVLAERLKDSV